VRSSATPFAVIIDRRVRVRFTPRLALYAALVAAILGGRQPIRAETVVVGPTDGSCPTAFFSRIQNAVDAAPPGTTIVLCPGTYAEQLFVTKRVRIMGAPGARLVPPALPLRTTSLRSGRSVAAAIILRGPATIDGLAIDASAHGVTTCDGTEPLLAGIYVRGVAASIFGTSVTGTHIPNAPSGCANGVGILVQGGTGAPRVRVEGNSIDGYQRAGIVVQDPGVRASVKENVVRGDGDTPARVQNGIEVSNGAIAKIQDNVVRDNAGPSGPACELDAGIVVDTPRAQVRGNQLENDAVGIRLGSRGHTVRENAVMGGPAGLLGIVLASDESRVMDNALTSVGTAGLRVDGNRNRLRGNVVSDVHATACDALRERPGCGTALAQCGMGLWLVGRANTVTSSLFSDVDVPVVDDGLANQVR
jgi:hypothetical protein